MLYEILKSLNFQPETEIHRSFLWLVQLNIQQWGGRAKFFKMMKIKIFVKHFSKANVLKKFYFDFYLCVIKLKAVSFIPPTPIKTSKKSCITFRGVGSILQCRNILISDFTFLTHSNYFVALGIYILET